MNTHIRLFVASALLFCGNAAFAQSGGRINQSEMLDQIKPKETTAEDVRKLFGPPARTMHFPRQGYDVLEYDSRDIAGKFQAQIAITSSDGKVRDITRVRPSMP